MKGDISSEKVKDLLEGWYRDQGGRRISAKALTGAGLILGKKLAVPLLNRRLQIKHMRKRWGSLSANGTLTLNTDLIRAPKECIDYVITHELGHLRMKTMVPNFIRFLDKVMPDWGKRKHRLEVTLA